VISDSVRVAESGRRKVRAVVALVTASVRKVAPFDPTRRYSPDEMEPYDALSDRFVRAVEVCIRFFRSYEGLVEAGNSDTLRDLLLRMEKLKVIAETPLWLEMRDVRNRIVHDYLPEQLRDLYGLLTGRFHDELVATVAKIDAVRL